MFDDPKKELQELEDQLLAAEKEDTEFQGLSDDILAAYAPVNLDMEEPPIRNFANGYGRNIPQTPVTAKPDATIPVIVEKKPRGLIFLAAAEGLAIAGVAVYWLLNCL